MAAYPAVMQSRGIGSGEVHLVISVDAEGHLTDYLITAYTEEAFAKEVASVITKWSYEPARVNGHARAASSSLVFKFSSDFTVIVEGLGHGVETHFIPELKNRFAYSACQLRQLDSTPTPVHLVQPQLATLPSKLVVVTVEFFIDEQGKVRAPTVERSEADNIYAAAAVEAISQWRFEPPLRHGRPVLVAAKQDFRFLARK
jgi:TonB family protein